MFDYLVIAVELKIFFCICVRIINTFVSVIKVSKFVIARMRTMIYDTGFFLVITVEFNCLLSLLN